jgi:hypothetical protein
MQHGNEQQVLADTRYSLLLKIQTLQIRKQSFTTIKYWDGLQAQLAKVGGT